MNKPNNNNNNNTNNNKRPRSRNSGNTGRRPQHSGNRSFDSNGPEVKVRGTATQICDKYLTLARDASSAGDRVRAESLLQHAEHYFRLVNGGDDARNNTGQNGERNHAPAGVTVSGEMMPDEIVAQPQPQQQQPQQQNQSTSRPSRRERAEIAAGDEDSAKPETVLTEAAAELDEAVIIETAAAEPEATDEAEVIVEPIPEPNPEPAADTDDNADQPSEVA